MTALFRNVLTADFHGSIMIFAVLVLRLILRKTPKKYICFLWMLAGLRLLLPIPLQSRFSLQPAGLPLTLPTDLPALLSAVWICAALVIASYSVISYLHLRQQVTEAVKAPGGWESDRIDTAFVLGFLKPKIYIPVGLSTETRKQILAHERTHLDKGDHWMKMIGFVALAIHWFNPLVWIAYILLCRDIEMACDERVVQFMELEERKAYASALLQCSTNRVHYAACPVAFGEVSVKYRIKSALSYKKPALWMSLLGVLSIVFAAVCLFTTPAEKVEVVVDKQEMLARSSSRSPIEFVPAESPASEPNPDWGLDLIADIQSPTGGSIVYVIEERFEALTGEMFGSDAHLEKWNGSEWEFLCTVDNPMTSVGFAQSRDELVMQWPMEIDWTLTQGSLEAGDYRFVQTVSTGEQTETLRAPFHIYREQLPNVEEEALNRCETALDKLISGGGYHVTLHRQEPDKKMIPIRHITVSGGQCQVEHELGGYTIWHSTGENARNSITGWDIPYRLKENRKYLFPEGQSKISQEEISFASVWTDYTGTAYRGEETYCFSPDGNLLSVERITQALDKKGNVTETNRIWLEAVTINPIAGLNMETDYVPEDSFTAQQNSPWGVFFRVDDDYLQPTGGEVWMSVNAVGVSDFTTDGIYWLEKRVRSHWERLGGENKTGFWGGETYQLTAQGQVVNVDWSADYGNLEAGVYRMGKRIFKGAESIITYAEFSIGESGGVFGKGGQEALNRVDAALARLGQNAYRVEQWYGPHNEYGTADSLTAVYWHYADTEVWDVYKQEQYSHSVAMKPEDDWFYGDWMKRSFNNEAYDCMYFPEGDSVISDDEITFAQSYSRTGWTDTTTVYTYRFNAAGEICEIITCYTNNGIPGGYVRYVVTDAPEAEIRAWVEQKMAERNG